MTINELVAEFPEGFTLTVETVSGIGEGDTLVKISLEAGRYEISIMHSDLDLKLELEWSWFVAQLVEGIRRAKRKHQEPRVLNIHIDYKPMECLLTPILTKK